MARNYFETRNIPQAVRDENLDGRALTLRRYAVSKFDAASTNPTLLTDNAADMANAHTNVSFADNTITFTNGTSTISAPATGSWNLIGREVIIGDATTEGQINVGENNFGIHVNMVNCLIRIVNGPSAGATQIIGYSQAGDSANRADDQFATFATSSSVNLYGCIISKQAGGGQFLAPADFIDSDLVATLPILPGTATGGRWIRSAMSIPQDGTTRRNINPYGLTQFEGFESDGFTFRLGNTGTNQPGTYLFDRPSFRNPGQQTYFDMNFGPASVTASSAPNSASAVGFLIGGPSFGTGVDDVLGTVGTGLTGGILGADATDRAQGGMIQFFGVGDSYFSDANRTNGAQGVKVRLETTINPATITDISVDFGNRLRSQANFTAGTVILEGISNAQGLLASSSWNDGTTDTAGFVNWMNWRPETAVGATVWNTTPDNSTSLPGVMLVPFSYAYMDGGTRIHREMDVFQSRRSFRWDVQTDRAQINRPDARQTLEINAAQEVINDLRNTQVKAENIGTDNEPDLTFPGSSARSLNDIRDAHRAAWYNYEFDLANMSNTVPLEATISNSTATGTYENATATSITVSGNGIGVVAGDENVTNGFTDANLTSLDMNGFPIEGSIAERLSITCSNGFTDVGNATRVDLDGGGNFVNNAVVDQSSLDGNWTHGNPFTIGNTLVANPFNLVNTTLNDGNIWNGTINNAPSNMSNQTFSQGGSTTVNIATSTSIGTLSGCTFAGAGNTTSFTIRQNEDITAWEASNNTNFENVLFRGGSFVVTMTATQFDTLGITRPGPGNTTTSRSGAHGADIRFRQADAVVVTETFTHPDVNGIWAVWNNTTNNYETAPVSYTAGGTPNTFNINSDNTNEYIIVWKQQNTPTIGYSTTRQVETGDNTLAANVTRTVPSTPIAGVLYDGTVTTGTSVDVENFTISGNDGIKVNITSTGISQSLGGPTQYLMLQATDDTDYIDTYIRRGRTQDFIIPSGADTTTYVPDLCILDSGVANTIQNVVALDPEGTTTAVTTGATQYDNVGVVQVVNQAGTSGLSGAIINRIGNPAGATPGQISAGTEAGARRAMQAELDSRGYTDRNMQAAIRGGSYLDSNGVGQYAPRHGNS